MNIFRCSEFAESACKRIELIVIFHRPSSNKWSETIRQIRLKWYWRANLLVHFICCGCCCSGSLYSRCHKMCMAATPTAATDRIWYFWVAQLKIQYWILIACPGWNDAADWEGNKITPITSLITYSVSHSRHTRYKYKILPHYHKFNAKIEFLWKKIIIND